jgi:Rieske Fe-S protein
MTHKKHKHSRRTFFKVASIAVAAIFTGAWGKIINNVVSSSKRKQYKVPLETGRKVYFVNDFIVVNVSDDIKVFSAHCTHLGCIINEFKDDKFVCPCHGSEFSKDGDALKGPATKPLVRLDANIDESGKILIINS